MRKIVQLAVFGGMAALCASQANADMHIFTFTNISGNLAGDAAIGEAQLTVTVTDEGNDGMGGNNFVLFTFSNVGPDASSITDVYFEDGTLLGIASLIDVDNGGDAGVDFMEPAIPKNLKAWNQADPPFHVKEAPGAQFSADSEEPVFQEGVNPGETLGVLVEVSGSFQDVIDAINRGMDSDTNFVDGSWINGAHIRIGINVQGFASGGSESFVNTPIPAPGAMVLAVLGMGLVGWYRRRTA